MGRPRQCRHQHRLYVLGRVAACTKDYTSARAWLEEDIALWRATGDIRNAPGALVALSCVALAEGDREEARQLLRESLARCECGGWRNARGSRGSGGRGRATRT